MKRECESCIKRKTTYCPTSMECMATDDMPYYQNRIMLLEEHQELMKLQNNWNELKKELKEKIDICDGCIDTMQSDLQEIAPRGSGKSYLTSEIFKNKVAKISFEFTLKHMQELEQVKDD